jgi:hypothetical protein
MKPEYAREAMAKQVAQLFHLVEASPTKLLHFVQVTRLHAERIHPRDPFVSQLESSAVWSHLLFKIPQSIHTQMPRH